MPEADFIERLRAIATHPAARGLADDAAVLGDLVLTHDMIVEGIHYLPTDPPADVAWKLLAVNLSDLAAKGAEPEGVLLGYPLREAEWDVAFADGLAEALRHFGVALLGGDTVSAPKGAPRMIGMTALGRSSHAPDRRGAQDGDGLWMVGAIGEAGAGLIIAQGAAGPAELLMAYRRPQPLLDHGRALASHANAMADVSDGLLIDVSRMAAASGLRAEIYLDAIPRSAALTAFAGDDRDARLAAVTAGDDYALILAADDSHIDAVAAIGAHPIGRFTAGDGLVVMDRDGIAPLPAKLGYEHG
ncbi:thiamine-phosphate kinase [Sphingomonas sp. CGMCC 1.13654]|uniref:Thiamine-monophosphate kinase n=1 Tax=Sphingomonas chungangi TaxID=2683589 RepID=A0A838LB18_9SPHN|nr:thiamine-phosphate kinase [Sphingomonas chungangi]MBA2935336.1 thiamine-phosphate kinase [Sphingomonas chungangi]MVW56843.1 thiamine-phosphate kinase [Sphingomonas chungangi]